MKFDYLAVASAGAAGANMAHILYPPSQGAYYVAVIIFGVLCVFCLAMDRRKS